MHEVNRLILIHPKKFVCRSFEEFGKDIGVSVYSIEEIEEFAYLIDDLKPELVLVHNELFQKQPAFFYAEFSKTNFKPKKIILIGTKDDLLLADKNVFSSHLIEPFDIGDLANILKGLLAEHH